MSSGHKQEQSSVFGRNEVRAAVALGYVALAALVFWPSSTSSHATAGAGVAANATAQSPAPAADPVAGAASAVVPAEKVAQAASSDTAAAEPAAKPVETSPEAAAAIAALAKISDYQTARWNPLHFKPEIDKASNEQCLACHKEILNHKLRETSPAGVKASTSEAWYQTLDTYEGAQADVHTRHLSTPYATKVMNLKCNFCHQGNDLREEAPHSSATALAGGFALRKMVDPAKTCLMCHGKFPAANMGFDQQTWPELREGMESPEAPNGCLSCHAEQFRTARHQVNYLNAAAIETAAKTQADVCYGCHGGRAWYRISYPYPRHPWPGMDPAVPDWAKDRPVTSAPEHLTGLK